MGKLDALSKLRFLIEAVRGEVPLLNIAKRAASGSIGALRAVTPKRIILKRMAQRAWASAQGAGDKGGAGAIEAIDLRTRTGEAVVLRCLPASRTGRSQIVV